MNPVDIPRLLRWGHAGVQTAWQALGGLCFPPRCHGCDEGEIEDADPAGATPPVLGRWFCAECRRGAEG